MLILPVIPLKQMAKNTDLSILRAVMILNQQTRHQRGHCALCHQYPDSKSYCNAVIFHNYSDTFPDHYHCLNHFIQTVNFITLLFHISKQSAYRETNVG